MKSAFLLFAVVYLGSSIRAQGFGSNNEFQNSGEYVPFYQAPANNKNNNNNNNNGNSGEQDCSAVVTVSLSPKGCHESSSEESSEEGSHEEPTKKEERCCSTACENACEGKDFSNYTCTCRSNKNRVFGSYSCETFG